MRFALAFVLSGFPFGGPRERVSEDRWIARDKLYHFTASALIQSVGHSVLRAGGNGYRPSALSAGAVTLTTGLGKEFWDRSQGRVFSWRDLAADVAGGGTAAIVIRQIDH